mgnify:CR=1 FL=1|jgi:hypothetical protein
MDFHKDIIITIPKSTKWVEYQKELDRSENGEILNFKVNFFRRQKSVKDVISVIMEI